MLEMLKERKAQLQAQGKKGFTLMEMLIVIAIIAILIAIAIPIFTDQLDSANLATGTANARSAFAEYMTDEMLKSSPSPTNAGAKAAMTASGVELKGCTVTVDEGTGLVTVSLKGKSNTFNTGLTA